MMKVKLLFILLWCSVSLIATNRYAGSSVLTFLHTDRNCYITGDEVFVKAYHLIDNVELQGKEVTVYVDLVNAENIFCGGEILPLKNGVAQGYMPIPDSLSTGNYYIRIYTNHSIAFESNEVLDSKQLFISNRFGRKGNVTSLNRPLVPRDTVNDFKQLTILNDNLSLNFDDTLYAKRSKVSLSIQSNKQIALMSGSISVKPVSEYEYRMAVENDHRFRFGNKKDFKPVKSVDFVEEKGMIVSGNVVHSTTSKPLGNILVLLATEDTIFQLKYALSNNKGDFSFLVDKFAGKQHVYLSCYSYPAMQLYTQAKIKLDDNFLGQANAKNLKTEGYLGSSDSLNLAKAIIKKAYNITPLKSSQEIKKAITYESKYFAGDFCDVVDMDDYVELPNFTEIAKEILPFVRFKSTDDGYRFSLFDGINKIIRDDPMVFVDGVPLTDNSSIVELGTDIIREVQVQNELRYYGDLAFERGLVFIWTRNVDFWDKRELLGTTSAVVCGYQQEVDYHFPSYGKESEPSLPDFRQTLYWNPNVNCPANDISNIEFYTSDEIGTYEVNFYGVLEDHSSVNIRSYIYVK